MRYPHKHLGVGGWCDCDDVFNMRPSLSWRGWVWLGWYKLTGRA